MQLLTVISTSTSFVKSNQIVTVEHQRRCESSARASEECAGNVNVESGSQRPRGSADQTGTRNARRVSSLLFCNKQAERAGRRSTKVSLLVVSMFTQVRFCVRNSDTMVLAKSAVHSARAVVSFARTLHVLCCT